MKNTDRGTRRRLCGWLCAAGALALLSCRPVQSLAHLPDQIRLTEGNGAQVSVSPLTRAVLDDPGAAVVSSLDQTLGNVSLCAGTCGETDLTLKLLGLIPIKQVRLSVEKPRVLIPGGQTVGVALRTEGVLVVGCSDLSGRVASPARAGGLRAGDLIQAVDGEPLMDSAQLSELISTGEPRLLTVRRDGRTFLLTVQPALDPRDDAYRLGAWVRDSTAGVGTLSFYDPESGCFGALGHAIADQDTGVILPVYQGEIMPGVVQGVHRGEKGAPGELISQLSLRSDALGEILTNNSFGIYGTAYDALTNRLYPDGIPVMSRDEAHLGPAQILSTVDGEGIHAYDVEIVHLSSQNAPSQRSITLRVTDPLLLSRTGGIVQGMSGSPIIQDGRLVGAVTHVYVNNPTMGYGLYIDWMLDQLPDTSGQQTA